MCAPHGQRACDGGGIIFLFYELRRAFKPSLQGGYDFCVESYRLLKVINYESDLTISSNRFSAVRLNLTRELTRISASVSKL